MEEEPKRRYDHLDSHCLTALEIDGYCVRNNMRFIAAIPVGSQFRYYFELNEPLVAQSGWWKR